MFCILKRGETAEQLSVRYGIPVCMLRRANPQFCVGAKVMIPPLDFCAAVRRHVVCAGETLFSLAATYHTTMYALLKENPAMQPRDFCAGAEILLPPPVRVHTCRPTDTVRSVAREYGISEEALRRENDLSDGLYFGMQLILPPR